MARGGRKFRKYRRYDLEVKKKYWLVQGRENVFHHPLIVFDKATYIKGFFSDGNMIARWTHEDARCSVKMRMYVRRATQRREPPLYKLVSRRKRILSRTMNCYYNDPRSTPYTERMIKGRKVYRFQNSPRGQRTVGRDRRNLFVEKGDSIWVMFSFTPLSRDLDTLDMETQLLKSYMSSVAQGYVWRRLGPRNISAVPDEAAALARHNMLVERVLEQRERARSAEDIAGREKEREAEGLPSAEILEEGSRKRKRAIEEAEEENVKANIEGLKNFRITIYANISLIVAQPLNA